MADNAGVKGGTDITVATDEISSAHYQKVKLVDGTTDSTTVVAVDGGVEANALRVTIASDSTGVLSVDDNAGSLTVDNAGTFAVQEDGAALTALQIMDDWDESDRAKVNLIAGQAGIAGGTGVDGATVPRVTLATDVALPAGTNAIGKLAANSGVDIGDVDVTSVIPGTGATNLGKAEDAGHTTGDTGVMALGVRNDAAGSLVGANADYAPLQVDMTGALRTIENSPPGRYDVFGHLTTAQLHNQVDIQFFRDTPGNLVTVTEANSGTAASSAGGALFSSSTNANGEAKGVTAATTLYRSGSEVYAYFTSTFTAGVASSYQRIGLYDDNNGFFIGYEGTSFGVTVRNNAVDATTASGSFSEDALSGGANSQFTRAGTPEAIDLTKLNVWRIRFGWLGSAPVFWEVMAPDGNWVVFHKTLYPNLQAVPHIRDADLPVTLHIKKTSADGTNLTMQTDCWGAGVTINGIKLSDTVTDNTIAPITRSVIVADNGAAYANIQSTTAGNLKISLQEASDGLDIGAGNAGAETIRVSIATDDVNLSGILADTANMDTNLGNATTALQIIDDWDESDRAKVNLIAGQAGIAGGTGVDGATVPRVTLATDVALPAGTNAIGKLAANSGVDIGDVDVTSIAAGSNLIGDVGLQPRTSNCLSIYYDNDLDETAVAVKASAGNIYSIHAFNSTDAPLFLQLYNVAQGSVTVGTTTPTQQYIIPGNANSDGAGFVLDVPMGVSYGTAITAACTTNNEGSGAPGANACVINILYK